VSAHCRNHLLRIPNQKQIDTVRYCQVRSDAVKMKLTDVAFRDTAIATGANTANINTNTNEINPIISTTIDIDRDRRYGMDP
jgi:demethoxyubiquinone hydroxylase (CLK1/Coq7/Cat5 family)